MIRILLLILDAGLVNLSFVLAFLMRYEFSIPPINFAPYKKSFVFLTLFNLASLVCIGIYKKRFRSSWDLFQRVFLALFCSTLVSIVFIYVFRSELGKFPTSIFFISLLINLVLVFKFHQIILKSSGAIKRRVLVIGKGNLDEIAIKYIYTVQCNSGDVLDPANYADIDEIVICGRIPPDKEMSMITFFSQKMNIPLVFSPICYIKLLSEKIKGNGFTPSLATFAGRKKDVEEFLMRTLDITGGLIILLCSLPLTAMAAILIKLTSPGPVFYTQERVGKDGKMLTLYKFRTMVQDAERKTGPILATRNDPRITKIGRFLRNTRIDEFPQLINVVLGQMSLVGPRPERLFFVQRHKALMEIRLAIRPGLTGLAQIRNAYDLHPRHKIKYDYLYIQRRSLLLNLYILAKTIPVMLLKKGT